MTNIIGKNIQMVKKHLSRKQKKQAEIEKINKEIQRLKYKYMEGESFILVTWAIAGEYKKLDKLNRKWYQKVRFLF
jgi:hypothetical protein